MCYDHKSLWLSASLSVSETGFSRDLISAKANGFKRWLIKLDKNGDSSKCRPNHLYHLFIILSFLIKISFRTL